MARVESGTAAVHDEQCALAQRSAESVLSMLAFLVERQDDWSDVIEHADRAMVMLSKRGETERERLMTASTNR